MTVEDDFVADMTVWLAAGLPGIIGGVPAC
jgi:hypothetical protein